MKAVDLKDVTKYVEANIGAFHRAKIDSLNSLKLNKVLKRKNPYLFKAKNVLTTDEIVRGIVDAHISSNEETLFGNWLEGLAIFINNKAHGGWKSGIQGIDLEFDNDSIRFLVNIKSGLNWGNNSQIKKMQSDFTTAIRTLRTSGAATNILCVNGCCYGKDNNPDKGNYFKYCGQRFWQFISGSDSLYLDIIKPLGNRAKEKNDEFCEVYAKIINGFTVEFSKEFCTPDMGIDWRKLVEFNSASINV